MLDVAVVPFVVGYREKDVVQQVSGRFDAPMQNIRNVAVTQATRKTPGRLSDGFQLGTNRCERTAPKDRSPRE